jgi:predicted amidohydrolase
MSTAFTAACVQVTAGPEIGPNIDIAETLIREARAEGADLVLTPETSDLMEPDGNRLAEKVEPEGRHIGLQRMRDLAQALACWILVGSFLVATRDGRPANRSFLIGPEGEVRARYDKIHMFDVDIPDGQRYRESRRFNPGAQAVVAETPWARLGLSVCYDLRFPQLYRSLAAAGASVLTSPSAFGKLCSRPGAVRPSCGRPRDLWAFPDCLPLGRGPGRGGKRAGRDPGGDRSRPIPQSPRGHPGARRCARFYGAWT